MFAAITEYGITSRAVKQGLLELNCWNPRSFTEDRHQTVDDRPFGGGPGMVMKIKPLEDALAAAKQSIGGPAKVIYLRSEEHTSELQSRFDIVCRLLLEKKKNKKNKIQ